MSRVYCSMQNIFGALNTNRTVNKVLPITYTVYTFLINNICDMCGEHVDFERFQAVIEEHVSIQLHCEHRN